MSKRFFIEEMLKNSKVFDRSVTIFDRDSAIDGKSIIYHGRFIPCRFSCQSREMYNKKTFYPSRERIEKKKKKIFKSCIRSAYPRLVNSRIVKSNGKDSKFRSFHLFCTFARIRRLSLHGDKSWLNDFCQTGGANFDLRLLVFEMIPEGSFSSSGWKEFFSLARGAKS